MAAFRMTFLLGDLATGKRPKQTDDIGFILEKHNGVVSNVIFVFSTDLVFQPVYSFLLWQYLYVSS